MTNELPKYHETFIPILEVLSSGEVIHRNELKRRVQDRYYADLPEDLLSMTTKNGEPLILNRIGWGQSYLGEGSFLFRPDRGMVQITDKGKAILKEGELTLAQLKKDPDYVKRQKKKGESKSLSKDEKQFENATPQDLIDGGVSTLENDTKAEILERLRNVDPYYFEKITLILLKKMGYGEFVETKKSGDGGIDGIINQDQLGIDKIYMQAKRYTKGNVREPDIRNFVGAMSGKTEKGVFVTTSSFDKSAEKKAEDVKEKIILVDGKKLASLMYQYGVGVQVKEVYEIKEIDDDFFEE